MASRRRSEAARAARVAQWAHVQVKDHCEDRWAARSLCGGSERGSR